MTDKECTHISHVNAAHIKALEEKLNLHVKYQQRAVEQATIELRERLQAINQSMFVTKADHKTDLEKLEHALHELENRAAGIAGGAYAAIAVATTVGGMFGAGIVFIVNKFFGE